MLTNLITLLVTLALVAGGAGAGVYAGQDTEPVKTFADVMTQTKTYAGPLSEVENALALLNRFGDEILAKQVRGVPVEEAYMEAYQTSMQRAFKGAAELDGEELEAAWLMIEEALKDQRQVMQAIQKNSPEEAKQFMWAYQHMFQYAGSLEDHEALQIRLQTCARVGELNGVGPYGPGPFEEGDERPGQPQNGQSDDFTPGNEDPGGGGSINGPDMGNGQNGGDNGGGGDSGGGNGGGNGGG